MLARIRRIVRPTLFACLLLAPGVAQSAETGGTPDAQPIASPPAPPPAVFPAASFASDPVGAIIEEGNLTLKMYGDTSFSVRNNDNVYINTNSSAPGVYDPGVWHSFAAPRIDLFGSGDVGKLSFLTEVMFEAYHNNVGVDIERLQLTYLVKNWLRLHMGRTHIPFGYYNDTYHHGSLFELTAQRPYLAEFEDSFGILLAHDTGFGIDGTLDAGKAGSFRYDAEVGNGRPADVTAVAMEYAEKNAVLTAARLRWIPIDGLILGVSGMRDVIPQLVPSALGVATRPSAEELVGGAHVVYMEHDFHIDIEAFLMRHNYPDGLPSTTLGGGFAELGYSVAQFTPYVRGEYVRFPAAGDMIYQYAPNSAEGNLVGGGSFYGLVIGGGAYVTTRDFTDFRIGIKWMPLPQLALRLEGERTAHDAINQEIGTVKVSFGF